MLTKIEKPDYDKTSSLFKSASYQLFPAAVLAGLHDGDVYVDEPDSPKSAFMLVRGTWGYLGGDPLNHDFNQGLNRAVFENKILPENAWGMFLSCDPSWRPALDEILHPRIPVEALRRHYIGRRLAFNWRENVPEGYTLQFIDVELRDRPGLAIPPDVEGLIKSWERIEDPTQHGFGYVAFQGETLAAYAVVDVVVGTRGDMGLVTEPPHRRKGLASVVSAATAEYAFTQRGLTEILWDCQATNEGSIRTAEKLGFDFVTEHTMILFDLDPAWNFTSLVLAALDQGKANTALEWSQRLMAETDQIPPLGYFAAACAYAGLGDQASAFQWLNTAIDQGWTVVNFTKERPEFKPWHDTAEWKSAIKRMH